MHVSPSNEYTFPFIQTAMLDRGAFVRLAAIVDGAHAIGHTHVSLAIRPRVHPILPLFQTVGRHLITTPQRSGVASSLTLGQTSKRRFTYAEQPDVVFMHRCLSHCTASYT